MPDTALVLLGAGGSRRMGAAKQLLEIGGAPMLRRAALAALASACRPVVVVCGASAACVAPVVSDLDVEIVGNADWQRGIGTSIRAGLRAARRHDAAAVVVALADQPLVGARDFDELVAMRRRTGARIVASRYAGTAGVPALFERSLFGDLLALPDDAGCKRLIQDTSDRSPGSVAWRDCPSATLDVDTPAQLAQARAAV